MHPSADLSRLQLYVHVGVFVKIFIIRYNRAAIIGLSRNKKLIPDYFDDLTISFICPHKNVKTISGSSFFSLRDLLLFFVILLVHEESLASEL